jgi:hypothetical protein
VTGSKGVLHACNAGATQVEDGGRMRAFVMQLLIRLAEANSPLPGAAAPTDAHLAARHITAHGDMVLS